MWNKKRPTKANIGRAIENSGPLKPMTFHCIIHQQALYGKHLNLSSVMDSVISTVNYIRSHGLSNRQFSDFLMEIKSEFPDPHVLNHISVR